MTNERSAAIPRRLGYVHVGDEEHEPDAPGESGRRQIWACGHGHGCRPPTDHVLASRRACSTRCAPSSGSVASSSTPPSAGWRRRRTPTTCAGSPSAGSLGASSTTSTAAPRTNGRCVPIAKRSPTIASNRVSCATCRRSTRACPCSARRSPYPSCWRPPDSPASPIPKASLPSPAPPSGPACRTRCRRSRHARSRRSPRPTETAAAGSRCTSGRTRACCATWSTGPLPPATRRS